MWVETWSCTLSHYYVSTFFEKMQHLIDLHTLNSLSIFDP